MSLNDSSEMDFNDLIPQKDSPKEPTIDFTEYTTNQEEGSTFEDSKLNQSPQKTVEEPKNASILSYTEEKKKTIYIKLKIVLEIKMLKIC